MNSGVLLSASFSPIPSIKSEYFKLLPNDIYCSFQSFAAIAWKTKKGFDGKSAIAQCFCIDDEATLILFRKGFSIFLITPLGDFTRLQHQETTPPPPSPTKKNKKKQKTKNCELRKAFSNFCREHFNTN